MTANSGGMALKALSSFAIRLGVLMRGGRPFAAVATEEEDEDAFDRVGRPFFSSASDEETSPLDVTGSESPSIAFSLPFTVSTEGVGGGGGSESEKAEKISVSRMEKTNEVREATKDGGRSSTMLV
jgi:hypothetical protein